jgi:predicted CXXCH cytochrome family protein
MVQRILGAAGACALLMGIGAATQEAAAGISNTRHNLSSVANSIVGRNQTTSTTDLCVFCHTPHAADTSAVPAGSVRPPLWNKTLPAAAGFTTYPQTSSLDGQVLPVGSVSVACLSCHDGSQAMDNIVNAPGSGDRIADGGGASGRNFAWTGGGVNTATGIMIQRTNGAAMLGKDLSDDHPIGIQYCGGFGTNGLAATGACRDPDFRAPATITVGANTLYYVDTPANLGGASVGQREKTDMQLYNRQFAGVTGQTPSVECGSCHDPHTEAQAAGQVSFLRVSNAGSNLCLVCHNK